FVAHARVQEHLQAEQIRQRELLGPDDRSIHMRLGGEVDDQIVSRKHLIQGLGVTDVTFDDTQAGVASHRIEILEVGRVGHLVVDRDTGWLIPLQPTRECHTNVGGPDEARPSRYEDLHGCKTSRRSSIMGEGFGCDRRASICRQPAARRPASRTHLCRSMIPPRVRHLAVAVYLATPPATHEPLGLQILSAGKHLWCEKPLSIGMPETERLVRTAEDAGLGVFEALMYRYHPQFAMVRSIIDSGTLGAIRSIEASFGIPHLD